MITGIQGIGKSFSLWLFAALIRQSPQSVKPIKVVFIPDCALLSYYKGNYLIRQFMLQFPNIPEFKELLTKDWIRQREFIYGFLDQLKSEGNIIILMVDQINSASNDGLKILDDLKGFSWTLVIYTESANNYILLTIRPFSKTLFNFINYFERILPNSS